MTTKKGIKIIRHMLPDVHLEYCVSTNLAWNGMYSLPSGIAVKSEKFNYGIDPKFLKLFELEENRINSLCSGVLTGITA